MVEEIDSSERGKKENDVEQKNKEGNLVVEKGRGKKPNDIKENRGEEN